MLKVSRSQHFRREIPEVASGWRWPWQAKSPSRNGRVYVDLPISLPAHNVGAGRLITHRVASPGGTAGWDEEARDLEHILTKLGVQVEA